MLYVRICFDKPNSLPLRDANRAAHRAYLRSGVIQIIQAGPLCASDTDDTNVASFFIVEADNRERVVAFHEDDPFTKVGLYGEVRIQRWDKHIG